MLILFAGEIISVLFILIKSLSNFAGTVHHSFVYCVPFSHRHTAGAHAIPGITYCVITRATLLLRLLWIPILSFDSILLVLYLYKGYQSYSQPALQDQSGVMRMVYKHSLLNFLA